MDQLKSLGLGAELPPQLRGKDDAAEKGFIWHSITERLSKIVAAVPGFEALSSEFKQGTFTIRKNQLAAGDNGPDWEEYIVKELDHSDSGNCLDISWFFLENYAYRVVLGATGYYKPGSPGYQQDPWVKGKLESLNTAIPGFRQVCSEVPVPTLEHLILCSLWGNRSDLSLSSGAVDSTVAHGSAMGKLLVDDTNWVVEYLQSRKNERNEVIMILDNCGAELLADLRLAAFLATNVPNSKVTLHVKPHPVFVSDATKWDVNFHVERICSEGIVLGNVLRDLISKNRIMVQDDLFYTSPLEFPYLPAHLKAQYDAAALLIVKGDANYRRILCDRYFPFDFAFSRLVKTFTKTPLLAIRTCKSPVIVGLDKHLHDQVTVADGNWCVNGTCGVLQFSNV